MVGCPLAVAAVLSCRVQADRWFAPHLAVQTLLTAVGGLVWSLSLCSALSFGLPPGCLLSIRVGVLSRLRFKGSGVSTMSVFNLSLAKMLCTWMSYLMLVMFLVHGLSGLGLLRLHLLMLIGSVLDPFYLGSRSWQVKRFVSGRQPWWSSSS